MLATGDLVGFWIAISRWATLDHVGNVNGFSRNLDRRQNLIEQLPCATDEWNARAVLVLAWTFADDHQVCVWIANAKDDVLARRCELAGHAPAALRLQRIEFGQPLEFSHAKSLRGELEN